MDSQKSKEKKIKIIFYSIIILSIIFVTLLALYIYFVFIKKEKFKITGEHKKRVSLLQRCMIAYGENDIPDLKDEEFSSSQVINNTILSILTIKLKGSKGETIQIFNQSKSIDLETNEIICISYKIGKKEYIKKVDNGKFTIPNELKTKVNETEFKFILYFPYDPKIIEKYGNEYLKKRNTLSEGTALALYQNNNRQLIELRLGGIFSLILEFIKESIETIIEKALSKVVSVICVSVIKYFTKGFDHFIIDSIGEFACDELGEFVANGVKNLIYNSETTKPAINYRAIVYEEIELNNYKPLPNLESQMLKSLIEDKNKNKLIKYIIKKSSVERHNIKLAYNSYYQTNLISKLEDELSGDFEDLVIDLFYHPVDFDCNELRRAMIDSGTIEDILIEILSMRPNNIIYNIKKRYEELFMGRTLIYDIKDETDGYFRDTLLSLLEANRADTVNFDEVKENVILLYEESKSWFPDQDVFIRVFTKQSKEAFKLIKEIYDNLDGKGLLKTVEDLFSGDFEDVLVGIYYAMVSPADYYAKKIHESIDGVGTHELNLNRIIVSRAEEDMKDIINAYNRLYHTSMIEDIIDDTSGYYRNMLISLATGKLYGISSQISYNYSMLFIMICIILF